MEERECPKCSQMCEGEDAKGNGVSLSFWCDECKIDLDDYNPEQKRDKNFYSDLQELQDEERRYEEKELKRG